MRQLLMVLAALFCWTSQAKILIVGDSEHPPYSYLENGEMKGIYYELVKYALKKYDQEVVIELHPWKRALKMVELGLADGVFPPHYFPNRRPYIGTYSTQILEEKVAVFCSGEPMVQALSWPNDFVQKTFVLSRGVKMGGEQFWTAVEKKEIKTLEAAGPKEALTMLRKGRADCHINDAFTIMWHNRMSSDESQSIHQIKTLSISGGFLGLSSQLPKPQTQRLLNYFNQQLSNMNEKGVTEQIIAAQIDK